MLRNSVLYLRDSNFGKMFLNVSILNAAQKSCDLAINGPLSKTSEAACQNDSDYCLDLSQHMQQQLNGKFQITPKHNLFEFLIQRHFPHQNCCNMPVMCNLLNYRCHSINFFFIFMPIHSHLFPLQIELLTRPYTIRMQNSCLRKPVVDQAAMMPSAIKYRLENIIFTQRRANENIAYEMTAYG